MLLQMLTLLGFVATQKSPSPNVSRVEWVF
ncbi:hypothetical protein ACHAW6_005683 [Cyclotella cf. meneghiniana]